jgi:hypothetical protein
MDCIYVAQNRDQWRAIVNTVMNLPQNVGKFFSTCATGDFSRMAQLPGVRSVPDLKSGLLRQMLIIQTNNLCHRYGEIPYWLDIINSLILFRMSQGFIARGQQRIAIEVVAQQDKHSYYWHHKFPPVSLLLLHLYVKHTCSLICVTECLSLANNVSSHDSEGGRVVGWQMGNIRWEEPKKNRSNILLYF